MYSKLETQLLDIFDALEEATTTGNVAGYQTPNAFSNSELDAKKKSILKRLLYKKMTNTKKHTLESHLDKYIAKLDQLTELSYRDYKNDDSESNRQKFNNSLKEIHHGLKNLVKVVENNIKLKREFEMKDPFWKISRKRIGKISELLILLNNRMKELSK